MEENILNELVKLKKVLKRKFESLKHGETEANEKLEKYFKPLSEPLNKLVYLSNNNTPKSELLAENEAKYNDNTKNNIKGIISSTPKKIDFKDEYETDTLKNNEYNSEMNNDTFYSQPSEFDISLSNLEENNNLDTVFGPYKSEDGKWKFGKLDLFIDEDKITIGSKSWAITPGLYSLLFHKRPNQYDSSELEIYKRILLDTNVHRKDFDPNNRIKGNRGYKYKEIINKLFKTSTHSGKGLMEVNPNKPNYIYWDNPNELVDRLKLLVASQQAGHNNHTNEIISIIEELREANIIY